MSVFESLRASLHDALVAVGIEPLPEVEVLEISRTREKSHGDWSANAAMVCAKAAGRNPRELAAEIVEKLELPKHVNKVEVAGPGFINFFLDNSWLHETLKEIVTAGTDDFARHNVGNGTKINVEFVSANPTGPLHAGHGRWAVFGDALCRLLERCGYEVVREFYINDRGRQTDLFGESLAAHRDGKPIPEDGYHGEYVAEWAKEMPADADPREWGIERALKDQSDTLQSMNVHFDVWSSEQELVASGAMDEVLKKLQNRDMVYEDDGAHWLRSSKFGDESDRVIIKSDGDPTYLLPDIAYHVDKFTRGESLIEILGADHHGYVPRMRAALVALGFESDRYEALIGQNVTLRRDGQELRLGKRAGAMILASDLLEEVGADVTRLVYLLQSIDTTQLIDLAIISAQSAENPVYYLQYAHARIQSLGRTAAERNITRAPLDAIDLSVLTDEHELEVLRELEALPEVVLAAMTARSPHQVTNKARELSAAFHRFWHNCPILRDDVAAELQQARLWLVEATRIGLAVSLDVLGVTAPDRL